MIRGLLYRFHRWVENYDNQKSQEAKYSTAGRPIAVASSDVDVDGLRFTVMSARGGTIVQIRRYDRRKDESDNITYIITDQEDIAVEVGRIVSMEMIKL